MVVDATSWGLVARRDHVAVRAVRFSPDGTRVATGSEDGSARVFDAATGAELARLDHDGTVWGAAERPVGKGGGSGSAAEPSKEYEPATRAEPRRLDPERAGG